MADGKVVIKVYTDVDKATEKFNQNTTALQRNRKAVDDEKTSLTGLEKAFAGLSIVYLTTQVASLGRELVKTSVNFERMTIKMRAAVGDMSSARQSMRFVTDLSEELGLALEQSVDGFSSFAASATRAGLTLEETQDIYKNVSIAATSMQLSNERLGLVFDALSQMASKGTVSMEELRQQLGESLPGAFAIAAKSMGVTTQEFTKMVSRGEVMAKDFLPAFAREIKNSLGQNVEQASKSAQSNFTRLENSILKLKAALGDELKPELSELSKNLSSGINDNVDKISYSFRDLLDNISLVTNGMELFYDSLIGVGAGIGNAIFLVGQFGQAISKFTGDIISNAIKSIKDFKNIITSTFSDLGDNLKSIFSFEGEDVNFNKTMASFDDFKNGMTSGTEDISASYEKMSKDISDSLSAASYSMDESSNKMTDDINDILNINGKLKSVKVDLGTTKKTETETKNTIATEVKPLTTETFGPSLEAYRSYQEQANIISDSISSGISALGTQIGDALTTPLQEGETAFQRFGSVALSVIQSVASSLISSSISKYIGASFGLEANAHGGAYVNGNRVTAFANGGIVGSPTFFPTKGGNIGLMGESGAEAIMPLERNSNGDLSVNATGMTQPNINIYNSANASIEVVKRPNNDYDIMVKQVNSIIASESSRNSMSLALGRQQQFGVQGA